MWPAARTVVFPMSAKRNRHHGAHCPWVSALGEHDVRLVHIDLHVHLESLIASRCTRCFGYADRALLRRTAALRAASPLLLLS